LRKVEVFYGVVRRTSKISYITLILSSSFPESGVKHLREGDHQPWKIAERAALCSTKAPNKLSISTCLNHSGFFNLL
jgi:hypothetical protein